VRSHMHVDLPPILRHKHYERESVFKPENLLREAKRQKSTSDGNVPSICILDPDGDIVRYLRLTNGARLNASWACYHTELYDFEYDGITLGIVGLAVGAPFAVLVAEELFASGCGLLISITSSGEILPRQGTPYFVLIERALRDEGTSYHYMAPSDYASIGARHLAMLSHAFVGLTTPVLRGTTWTTDAPFRETGVAIEQARSEGILAVEMEAAALYAFSEARGRPVVCFAYVTNQMGQSHNDFEKGEAGGAPVSLGLVAATAKAWLSGRKGHT